MKLTFDTRDEAEDYIVWNPQRCRTTQFMEAVRPAGSTVYHIAVYKFVTSPYFNGEFLHYLRRDKE